VAARRPNILLLFTDQQRYDTIAACGYDHMITPNMDRLVREGCHFANAHTPNPVCIPTRHNILTGLPAKYHGYPENLAHPFDRDLPTLPRILANAGYNTRAIGKMHFRPPRRHHGFDKMELMEEIPPFRQDDEYAMYLKEVGYGHVQNIHGVRNILYMLPQRSLLPEEHHGSTWVGDRSVRYIRENAGRRPFFLWSSWIAPHPPFDVPGTFSDLYRDRDLPAPLRSATPVSVLAESTARHANFPAERRGAYLRRMRELYFGAVSLVDKNVGKILDALEETGELDNTLVLLTSDHGEMLGDHGCFQKGLPYNSASRIPFVVRYPERVGPGCAREEFVDLNDILPTILDVAGCEYPGAQELAGGSVFRDDKDRTHQYIEYGRDRLRWVSIRDDRCKYTYYYAGAREELFDLDNDPHETTNLLFDETTRDAEVEDKRKALRRALLRYEARWGLDGCVADGDFIRLPPMDRLKGRDPQRPRFPANIVDERERSEVNDYCDELIAVVRDEPIVKLHELDLEGWRRNGAPPETIERIRREKL